MYLNLMLTYGECKQDCMTQQAWCTVAPKCVCVCGVGGGAYGKNWIIVGSQLKDEASPQQIYMYVSTQLTHPLGTRRCYDVELTSLTSIQRCNNIVCPVASLRCVPWNELSKSYLTLLLLIFHIANWLYQTHKWGHIYFDKFKHILLTY